MSFSQERPHHDIEVRIKVVDGQHTSLEVDQEYMLQLGDAVLTEEQKKGKRKNQGTQEAAEECRVSIPISERQGTINDWSERDVLLLIGLWDDRKRQFFKSNARKKTLWTEVAEELSAVGHSTNWSECRCVCKSLVLGYKKARLSEEKHFFKFYDVMRRVYGPLYDKLSTCDEGPVKNSANNTPECENVLLGQTNYTAKRQKMMKTIAERSDASEVLNMVEAMNRDLTELQNERMKMHREHHKESMIMLTRLTDMIREKQTRRQLPEGRTQSISVAGNTSNKPAVQTASFVNMLNPMSTPINPQYATTTNTVQQKHQPPVIVYNTYQPAPFRLPVNQTLHQMHPPTGQLQIPVTNVNLVVSQPPSIMSQSATKGAVPQVNPLRIITGVTKDNKPIEVITGVNQLHSLSVAHSLPVKNTNALGELQVVPSQHAGIVPIVTSQALSDVSLKRDNHTVVRDVVNNHNNQTVRVIQLQSSALNETPTHAKSAPPYVLHVGK